MVINKLFDAHIVSTYVTRTSEDTRMKKKNSKDSTNNLYNYHHLLPFLPGKETLHPFAEIACGNVTSKLIITIKISFSVREGGNRQVGGRSEGVVCRKKIARSLYTILLRNIKYIFRERPTHCCSDLVFCSVLFSRLV